MSNNLCENIKKTDNLEKANIRLIKTCKIMQKSFCLSTLIMVYIREKLYYNNICVVVIYRFSTLCLIYVSSHDYVVVFLLGLVYMCTQKEDNNG